MRATIIPLPVLAILLILSACTATGTPTATTDPGPIAVPAETTAPAVRPPEDAPATPPAATLDDLGPAPELINEVWLNTTGPLMLKDLRGQVVLLEMWTFG